MKDNNMREILESLRIYAQEPLPDSPPEIMPWDESAQWAWLGAAKHTLGLLLAGEEPGSRLFDAADYLLTFAPVAFRSGSSEEALLNGTALALCGYLCDGRHPEAATWRLTGCARAGQRGPPPPGGAGRPCVGRLPVGRLPRCG